jgi:hypothetical protein
MLVKLNIGGSIFWTSDETLMSRGSNMLSVMVRHENPAQLIDGAYFIDRDPKIFRWILNYLRGSNVLPDKESPKFAMIKEEAEYFSIDPLLFKIKHILCPSFQVKDNVIARGQKFTIMSVEETGYIGTCGGSNYHIDASDNVELTTIDLGDKVMAFHKPSAKTHVWNLCGQTSA